MADLAQLIAWRNKLEKARYGGLRAIEFDGVRREFKTDAELRQALADVNRQINQEQSGQRIAVVRVSSSKGV